MNSIYRCISGVLFFLVLLVSGYHFFKQEFSFYSPIFYLSAFSLIIFLITFIIPQRIELLSAASLAWSVYFLLTANFNDNQIMLILYLVTWAILFSRGYFRKGRWIKMGFVIAAWFILFMFQLKFGSLAFISAFLRFAVYGMLIFLLLLFYYLYLRNEGKSPIEKFLDLTQFPELTERDKEWLLLIQKETKYSTIASEYCVSLGTVKNRMRYIFDVIDVSDRIGFMATYGGYELKCKN